MAVTVTGTPLAVTWAAGADPAGQSITIPSDATAVYVLWQYYVTSGSGWGLSTATLNSDSPDESFEITGDSVTEFGATGVAAWYNPSTGSQTLDVSWDSAPTEGPITIVYYTKGGDTTAWTDADADANTHAVAVSVTLTTDTDELVIKLDTRFDDPDETPPSNTGGWTSGATQGNGQQGARAAHITPSGSTQVCPSEDESYSTIVAVSIPPAADVSRRVMVIS